MLSHSLTMQLPARLPYNNARYNRMGTVAILNNVTIRNAFLFSYLEIEIKYGS